MLTKKLLRLKYKILAIFYTVGLSYISLIPLNNIHLPDFHLADKVAHLLLYLGLSIVWLLALPSFLKHKILFFFIIIIWGIIIEFLQAYAVVGRTGDIFDALANSIGTFVGIWVFSKILSKFFKSN